MTFDVEALDQLFRQGNDLLAAGRFADAETILRRVIEQVPTHPPARANLGVARAEQGAHLDAIAEYEAAIQLNPRFVDAWYNRGNSLLQLKRFQEAVESYAQALQLNADFVPAWVNHGLTLYRLGRLVESIGSYQEAIRRRPNHPDALNNLGLAFQHLGRIEDAWACFDKAIELRPGWADARCNRAQVRLLTGRFSEGWEEYESRWEMERYRLPTRPMPSWTGLPLNGESVLIRAEQGFGDAIQFIRFARDLKSASAGRVLFEVHARLHRLLSTVQHVDELIAPDSPCIADLQISLLSLPRLFEAGFRRIPNQVPYITAEPERVHRWHAEGKIGLSWQGNRDYPEDHLRSIPLHEFTPLMAQPGRRFISLQRGDGAEQLEPLRSHWPIDELGPDFDADGAFVDTAALMMSLDLIITSDTAIAHLAGALGRPVWILLAYSPEWRWLRDRDDSPWYPTARLFRQPRPGDWAGVMNQIAAELARIESV